MKHFTVKPTNRKKIVSSSRIKRRRVYAAEGDEFDVGMNDTDNAFADRVDDIADNLEDIKDSIDDMEEDDVEIDIENNLDGHYIAECDKCKGIFISAVVKSDQVVTSVSGTCPLCQEESDQYLKWYIVPNTDEEEDEMSEGDKDKGPSPQSSNKEESSPSPSFGNEKGNL